MWRPDLGQNGKAAFARKGEEMQLLRKRLRTLEDACENMKTRITVIEITNFKRTFGDLHRFWRDWRGAVLSRMMKW